MMTFKCRCGCNETTTLYHNTKCHRITFRCLDCGEEFTVTYLFTD